MKIYLISLVFLLTQITTIDQEKIEGSSVEVQNITTITEEELK